MIVRFSAGKPPAGDYTRRFVCIGLVLALVLGVSACGAGDIAVQPPGGGVQEDSSVDRENEAVPAGSPEGHEDDAARFAGLYPVTPENPFIFATYDEIITQLEWGTGIIVFGFPDCPRCQNAFPVLEKAFKQMDMDKYAGFRGRILYYNIFGDREENNEHYQTIVSYLADYLLADGSGNPRVYMPDVFFLASGKIMGNHMDTVSSLEDPWDSLNTDQEAELLAIYMDLIAKIEDCNC